MNRAARKPWNGKKLFAVLIVGGRAEFCWCDGGVDKSACVGDSDRSLGMLGDSGGWYKIV